MIPPLCAPLQFGPAGAWDEALPEGQVTIPAWLLEESGIAPVCVKTGERTERTKRVEIRDTPPAAYLALMLLVLGLVGAILALVVIHLVSQRTRGRIPFSAAAARRRRAGLALVAVSSAVGVASAVGVVLGTSVWLLGVAALAAGAVIVGLARDWTLSVPATFDATTGTVELRRVHPAFVDAVSAAPDR